MVQKIRAVVLKNWGMRYGELAFSLLGYSTKLSGLLEREALFFLEFLNWKFGAINQAKNN